MTSRLDEIWLFIAQDSLDAADRFVDFLTDKFPLLASSPRMGRRRDDLSPGLRGFPVNQLRSCTAGERNRTAEIRVSTVR